MASCNSGDAPDKLYTSDAFSIERDRVIQGKNTAIATSPQSMTSNYQSPANNSYSRLIEFKFSINGKDNELPAGENHMLILEDGEYTSPVIVFGQRHTDSEQPPTQGLEANSRFRIRVDLNQVLHDFETKGYFEAYNGEKIAKQDFKGIFVAGNASPLSWDFENLGNMDGLRLEDGDGDGIYETELIMNSFNPDDFTSGEWKLTEDISNFPQISSDIPLLDALYNLSLEETVLNMEEDGTFRTGAKWPGVWTRDISYSVLLSYALIAPEYSMNSLRRKVKRNRIIQDTGSGGAWPVSSDRTTWALAAWELYLVTGDEDWLRESFEIIRNSVNDDLHTLNSSSGLIRGESSFLDWRKQSYPLWMNNVDIYKSEALGTNTVHYQTLRILGMMGAMLEEEVSIYIEQAEKLKNAINRELWLEEQGYYSQYRYGRRHMYTSPRSETLGEAFTVLFDIASPEQRQRVVKNTPVVEFGSPCFYPYIDGIPPYHNNGIWPFVQAYWNMAAAKAGNELSLDHGLASMFRAAGLFLTNKENMVAETGDFRDTEVNSDRQLWSVAGNLAMMFKVFLGMEFSPQGVEFSPSVPRAWKGTKSIEGLNYRNAVLNIHVNGHGNRIKSFTVDGVVYQTPFLKHDLEGAHEVVIELSNEEFTTGQSFIIRENDFAPETPRLELSRNGFVWSSVTGAEYYSVYANGQQVARVTDTAYLFEDPLMEYTIVAHNGEGVMSFAAEPIIPAAEETALIYEAETAAPGALYEFINYTGSGFIETTTSLNTEIVLEVEVEESGAYWLDLRYSNGSGPWNTDNKCAIRSLWLNDQFKGVVVMPQRGTDEWSSWGYTNTFRVILVGGKNKIRISYEPFNTNMNVEVNRAMIDHLRLIPAS